MNEIYLHLASIFPFAVPAIRDYIDVLNNAYDSFSSDINLQQILQQTFLFIIASIKYTVLYFLSFQWVRDLTYLPVLVPQVKMEILKEHFFLQTPQSNFFTFLEIPSYTYNKFLLGFLNSFFLCLPLSIGHIIATRRLLIQGLAAGIFSSLGTISGQIILLICILFGGRFFITPWFNFQVLNYFFGIGLVVSIIYDMATERSIRIIDTSNKYLLLKIFILNFALAWTEQSCIFQYFGNLTLGAEPTIIEVFSSPTELQSILTHITYVCGIILGSCVFTSIFIFSCLKISSFWLQFLAISYSRWVRRLNFILITLTITFTFTSIPFYSFDYLILSNLGFVSQDKSFKNTILSSKPIPELPKPILANLENKNETFDNKLKIDTDITTFDSGRYLMFDANDSFEQLNYQGEYLWFNKNHRKAYISHVPTSLRPITNFFHKIKKSALSASNTRSTHGISKQTPTKSSSLSSEDSNILNLQNFTESEGEEILDSSDFADLQNLSGRMNFRNETDHNINSFFEPLIVGSVSREFLTYRPVEQPIFEKNFKQKYYSNPIYKLLLSADIDLFLSRQPRYFALNANQEKELFEKRMVLADYYDSLRYYNQLPYNDEFQDTFNGSKSYADRIYNQQFKGTLKVIRRLFTVTLSPNKKETLENENFSKNTSSLNQNSFSFISPIQNDQDNLILKFDQPLYKQSNKNGNFNPIFHEEFPINRKKNTVPFGSEATRKVASLQTKNRPFIQLTNPIPFYVGWDEQLRKLVITNRLSPRCFAGYYMKFPNKTNTDYSPLNPLVQKSKTIDFTSWPLPKNGLENFKNESTISYNVLFDSLANLENSNKVLFEDIQHINPKDEEKDEKKSLHGLVKTVPLNIAQNYPRSGNQLQDIMPYTRGGFVWPGHFNLKIKLKDSIFKN